MNSETLVPHFEEATKRNRKDHVILVKIVYLMKWGVLFNQTGKVKKRVLDEIEEMSYLNKVVSGATLSSYFGQQAIQSTIGLYSRALQGRTFAHVNRNKSLSEEEIEDLLFDQDYLIGTNKNNLATENEIIEIQLKNVYSAVVLNDQAVLRKTVFDLMENIWRQIDYFAPLSRDLRTISAYCLSKGKNGLGERVGELNVNVSRSIRNWIGYSTGALTVLFQHLWYDPILDDYFSESALETIQNIHKIAFDRDNLPDGTNLDVKGASEQPLGRVIETKGFVKQINTFRNSAGELISRFLLSDPSSLAEIWVQGKYVHFEHIGIASGTYVTLSGELKDGVIDGENAKYLQVGKFSMNELKDNNWKLRLLDIARPYFDSYRGNLLISWSLSPHRRYGDSVSKLGASEMLFRPLVGS